ncbi:hypothetical protein [Salinirubrum litoreum]|uniref:Uncharacterized protein n=1 Tax=Salinirubrum litoreum TaxID=1126234 RepID=A0ABD5R816_9EURY|nr:hypothetical protein [Salinirubrum litoreum]
MTDPESILAESPVTFQSAVAYALHPEMRRLLIVYVAGALILPFGLNLLLGGPFQPVLVRTIELLLGIVVSATGAALFFGGLVGAAFKLVTDANLLANAE